MSPRHMLSFPCSADVSTGSVRNFRRREGAVRLDSPKAHETARSQQISGTVVFSQRTVTSCVSRHLHHLSPTTFVTTPRKRNSPTGLVRSYYVCRAVGDETIRREAELHVSSGAVAPSSFQVYSETTDNHTEAYRMCSGSQQGRTGVDGLDLGVGVGSIARGPDPGPQLVNAAGTPNSFESSLYTRV